MAIEKYQPFRAASEPEEMTPEERTKLVEFQLAETMLDRHITEARDLLKDLERAAALVRKTEPGPDLEAVFDRMDKAANGLKGLAGFYEINCDDIRRLCPWRYWEDGGGKGPIKHAGPKGGDQ